MRIFKLEDGREYNCPDTACVFCDHCTDIFYDYTHGPYLILCELNEYNARFGSGCEHFIEGIIRQIK